MIKGLTVATSDQALDLLLPGSPDRISCTGTTALREP
jgi:hypothetical protein